MLVGSVGWHRDLQYVFVFFFLSVSKLIDIKRFAVDSMLIQTCCYHPIGHREHSYLYFLHPINMCKYQLVRMECAECDCIAPLRCCVLLSVCGSARVRVSFFFLSFVIVPDKLCGLNTRICNTLHSYILFRLRLRLGLCSVIFFSLLLFLGVYMHV